VVDPASLHTDRRARLAKTDRIDAERLLRSLMAYLRGEPKVWSVVQVPSVAEEDARCLHRERGRLVTERVSMSTASRAVRLRTFAPQALGAAGRAAHPPTGMNYRRG